MAGITSNGITLSFAGTTAGALTSISGPDGDVPAIDTTTMDDTVGTSIPGIPQPGSFSFSGNYIKTTYAALHTAKMAKTTGAVILTFSDSSKFSNAAGYITKLDTSGEKDNPTGMNGTIQLSGAITHSTS